MRVRLSLRFSSCMARSHERIGGRWFVMATAPEPAQTVSDQDAEGEHIQKVLREGGYVKVLALPRAQTKTVYFVRHAEALHNEAFRLRGRVAYTDPIFFDPELTTLGKSQCEQLRQQTTPIEHLIDLLVVSPLRRTLQTAVLGFEKRQDVPWLALEVCRERIGMNTCDKRRAVSEQRVDFPMVDFSHVESNKDEIWKADHRETTLEMAVRGTQFLDWLRGRPEANVAVVTHSAFLLSLFTQVLDCSAELKKWFENGEMRPVVLQFPQL